VYKKTTEGTVDAVLRSFFRFMYWGGYGVVASVHRHWWL